MARPLRNPQQIDVLVLRAEGASPAFRWELRGAGMGLPIEVGETLYRSVADARLAGEQALAALRADDERTPPDDPPC